MQIWRYNLPIFRYKLDCCGAASSELSVSLAPISTMHKLSAAAGNACILLGAKQSEGSNDIILTVLSCRPTARNHERCSPTATFPRAIHITSEGIFFLSVYSFNCPV